MKRTIGFGLAFVASRVDTGSMDRTPLQERRNYGPSSPAEQPSHDAAGVDLMLVRDALAMTPAERLRSLTEMMASIARLGRIA